ncbi:GNAT family N-acetyltransferase [Streptomyces sp. NPDC058757]|uniref:GNAT family N-acetyltransferase n=1 Tax=unclassified Streptomyces TaxID=2593676 RepID=UPI0036B73C80
MDLRRAARHDAAELTQLRRIMLDTTRPTPDGEWVTACEAAFTAFFEGPCFVAFAVDAPDGAGLDSCPVSTHAPRFHSPTSGSPFHGEIHSAATDPAWRRRDYGRAVVTATMQWLADQGCFSVRLNASPAGLPLSTELGFRPIPAPAMTWSCQQETIQHLRTRAAVAGPHSPHSIEPSAPRGGKGLRCDLGISLSSSSTRNRSTSSSTLYTAFHRRR